MGIFSLKKKKSAIDKKETDKNDVNIFDGDSLLQYIVSNLENPTEENILKALDRLSQPSEDLEHLTAEGELPWGWHTHNKDFLDKINVEYTCFLNSWLDARNESPKELYSALESFVTYLEDVEKICKSKGECFEFWFTQILTAPTYLQNRKEELKEFTENLDELQRIYEKKLTLKPDVIKLLKENNGILQSDFKKMFEQPLQSAVLDVLYELSKNGELEKIKQGRSFALHYKK